MAVTTFQSRWGNYQVIEVKMSCKPEPQADGTIRQSVMSIKTTDSQDATTICSWTIWLRPDGTSFSGNSHRFTTSKAKAREHYKKAITPTEHKIKVNWLYSIDEPWIA